MEFVTSEDRAWELLNSLDYEQVYALDFETTGLSPLEGEVRLTQICGHGVAFILDHFQCGPFKNYAEQLSKGAWAVFYSLFEGNWIDTLSGNENVTLYDVGHMKRAKMGGGPMSLALQVQRDLGITLDKTEQDGVWSRPVLTQEQLDYAMADAIVTWALWVKWNDELTDEQWNGFLVVNDAWRGTLEMQETGMCLDSNHHAAVVEWWMLKRDLCERYLRKFTPPSVIANLKSDVQLSNFFKNEMDPSVIESWPKTEAKGQLKMDKHQLRLLAAQVPYPFNRWIAALIRFKYYNKYLSTYGQKLLDRQQMQGYIPSKFNMAAAITCRYSSSSENLQNIPKQWLVRRSFIAKDRRRPKKKNIKLVIADYSSIEVRVLGEISGDEALLKEAIHGDIHSTSAADILHMPREQFFDIISDKKNPKYGLFKTLRGRAKALTFAVCYGAGILSLSISLRTTYDGAELAMQQWAERYPKAYHYRQIMFEKLMHTGFIEVADGRTIFVHKNDRSLPVAANYGIQSAAASVMYRAIYHVQRMLSASDLDCFMCATVHDELLLLSDEADAPAAKVLLEEGMRLGWLDIFPGSDTTNLATAAIGDSWGDKE
jgi:DNA polymerase-1